MKTNSIRRNDFVTLNNEVKVSYSDRVVPIGTKCRVWKAKRDGTLAVTPEKGNDHYVWSTIYTHHDNVTKIEAPKANVKVDDIFVCSWGYEQTNIDFYKIVEVKNASVKYVKIGVTRKYDGPMHGECVPNPDSVGTNVKMARIRVDGGGTVSFRVTSYSWAYPWSGEACFFSEWH